MMIKLVQKRALIALRDSRTRLSQDIRDETECTAGELLGLTYSGFICVPDRAGTHVCITPRGLAYLEGVCHAGEER
jgi:hypothetical protein